jgi:hypothetical protein
VGYIEVTSGGGVTIKATKFNINAWTGGDEESGSGLLINSDPDNSNPYYLKVGTDARYISFKKILNEDEDAKLKIRADKIVIDAWDEDNENETYAGLRLRSHPDYGWAYLRAGDSGGGEIRIAKPKEGYTDINFRVKIFYSSNEDNDSE